MFLLFFHSQSWFLCSNFVQIVFHRFQTCRRVKAFTIFLYFLIRLLQLFAFSFRTISFYLSGSFSKSRSFLFSSSFSLPISGGFISLLWISTLSSWGASSLLSAGENFVLYFPSPPFLCRVFSVAHPIRHTSLLLVKINEITASAASSVHHTTYLRRIWKHQRGQEVPSSGAIQGFMEAPWRTSDIERYKAQVLRDRQGALARPHWLRNEKWEAEYALWPFQNVPDIRIKKKKNQLTEEPQMGTVTVKGRRLIYFHSKLGCFIMKSVSLKSNLCFCVALTLTFNCIVQSSCICFNILTVLWVISFFLNYSSVMCSYLIYYSTGGSSTNPNFPRLCGEASLEIPFVSLLVCPCWASIYKEEHSFRASSSSGGLIIHDLSMWIMAHSPTTISRLVCTANPSKCLCCLSQQ